MQRRLAIEDNVAVLEMEFNMQICLIVCYVVLFKSRIEAVEECKGITFTKIMGGLI